VEGVLIGGMQELGGKGVEHSTKRQARLPIIKPKVLDKQSQLMNSPCGDPNKELNHKEENQ